MPRSYLKSEFDLRIEEEPLGLRITQSGRSYLARKWQLTTEVHSVIDLALEHGLTCLWQENHPSGPESNHISFSFDRTKSSWVFVIGAEAKPPLVKRVTFNKRLKEYFKNSGLGWVWDWETAGGKNILVMPRDLKSILETLPLDSIRKGELPAAGRSALSRRRFFSTEADLEDAIFAIVTENAPQAPVFRQMSFAANSDFEVASRPDLLVVGASCILILELKLYRGGEPELAQVKRYMSNAELQMAFDVLKPYGVLIAERFEESLLESTKRSRAISLVKYEQDAVGLLGFRIIAGPDVISPYLPVHR